MAAVALLVRLDSPGPIFFRQVRVGRHGRRFGMPKFRSMVVDAEQCKAALADRNETVGFFKITEDPRITRVVRKTSLDEVPQFSTSCGANMSIVGRGRWWSTKTSGSWGSTAAGRTSCRA